MSDAYFERPDPVRDYIVSKLRESGADDAGVERYFREAGMLYESTAWNVVELPFGELDKYAHDLEVDDNGLVSYKLNSLSKPPQRRRLLAKADLDRQVLKSYVLALQADGYTFDQIVDLTLAQGSKRRVPLNRKLPFPDVAALVHRLAGKPPPRLGMRYASEADRRTFYCQVLSKYCGT